LLRELTLLSRLISAIGLQLAEDRSVPQVLMDEIRWTCVTEEHVGGGVEVPTLAFRTWGVGGEAYCGTEVVQGDAVP